MTVSHDCNLDGMHYELWRRDHTYLNILVSLVICDDILPANETDGQYVSKVEYAS